LSGEVCRGVRVKEGYQGFAYGLEGGFVYVRKVILGGVPLREKVFPQWVSGDDIHHGDAASAGEVVWVIYDRVAGQRREELTIAELASYLPELFYES
jgi:NOL1/NOP2/fmu family ribosome biogenesis protein